MIITLTVSPHGTENNPFFLLSVSRANKQFIPPQIKFLLTGGADEPVAVNLGGAFDSMGGISAPAINEWIIQNNYHDYPYGHPTKLRFRLMGDWLVFVEQKMR